jgi:hypothetical protein
MAVSRYASERYPDAAAVALGAIALGQPIADTIQASYPKMSRAVAVQFARTAGSSSAARELRSAAPTAAANAGISADRVTVDTALPIRAEYTVIYTVTDSEDNEYKLPILIRNLPAGASRADILAEADSIAPQIASMLAPPCSEFRSAADAIGSTFGLPEIVRVRINPIH